MSTKQTKQMLYISVQDVDTKPYIKFETEPYYHVPRRVDTEGTLPSLETEEVLKDEAFVEKLGFFIVMRLLVQGTTPRKKNFPETQVIYPQSRGDQHILRIELEKNYEYKPHRHHCASLPLPTLDFKTGAADMELQKKVARIVLEHLPLTGWEEAQKLV